MNNNHWIKTYAYNAFSNALVVDLILVIQESYLTLLPMFGITVLTGMISYLAREQEIQDFRDRQQK